MKYFTCRGTFVNCVLGSSCAFMLGCHSEPTGWESRNSQHDAESAERRSSSSESSEVDRREAELRHRESELQRQQAELERQEIEAAANRLPSRIEATGFNQEEFADFQREMKADLYEGIGQLLLQRTHPTGDYISTERPLVNLTPDRQTINVRLTVNWQGGLSENVYETTFSFRIKTSGLDRLEVDRDRAIINIDPQLLRIAEQDLRDLFDPNR